MRIHMETDQAAVSQLKMNVHMRKGDECNCGPITTGTVLRLVGLNSPTVLIFMDAEHVEALRKALGSVKGGAA